MHQHTVMISFQDGRPEAAGFATLTAAAFGLAAALGLEAAAAGFLAVVAFLVVAAFALEAGLEAVGAAPVVSATAGAGEVVAGAGEPGADIEKREVWEKRHQVRLGTFLFISIANNTNNASPFSIR